MKYATNVQGIDSIESSYCTCKNGSRTVGCCSHVTSIIYYYACGKYLSNQADPAGKLRDIFPYYKKREESSDESQGEEPKTIKAKKSKEKNISKKKSI